MRISLRKIRRERKSIRIRGMAIEVLFDIAWRVNEREKKLFGAS